MVREKEGKLIVDLAGYRRYRGWFVVQHHWKDCRVDLPISTAPTHQHTPKPKLTSRRRHNNMRYKKKISSIPRPTYTKLDMSSALYSLVTVSKRNRNDLQGSQSGTRLTDGPRLQRTLKGLLWTGIDTPRWMPVKPVAREDASQ
jgi:hypothetical protein